MTEKGLTKSPRLHRMRSASSTTPNNEKIESTLRRKSTDSTDSIDGSKPVESQNSEIDPTTNLQQVTSLTKLSTPNSKQSLTNRMKPPLLHPHRPSPSSDDLTDSTPPPPPSSQ